MSDLTSREAEPDAISVREARKRQRAYAAKRRAWAKAVGRPYTRADRDPRPPPGELDVGPDDEDAG